MKKVIHLASTCSRANPTRNPHLKSQPIRCLNLDKRSLDSTAANPAQQKPSIGWMGPVGFCTLFVYIRGSSWELELEVFWIGYESCLEIKFKRKKMDHRRA